VLRFRMRGESGDEEHGQRDAKVGEQDQEPNFHRQRIQEGKQFGRRAGRNFEENGNPQVHERLQRNKKVQTFSRN